MNSEHVKTVFLQGHFFTLNSSRAPSGAVMDLEWP